MKNLSYLFLVFVFLYSCYSDESFSSFADEAVANGEHYNLIAENPFVYTSEEATSTFSIDADGGSYANCRRFINNQMLPPLGSVRTEEFINYFPLNYALPTGAIPIALNGEVSDCPWQEGNKLIRIGIKGKDIPLAELPPSNVVLLVDVSGSMNGEDKIDLLKYSFHKMTAHFDEADRISIVTYAGSSKVILEGVAGNQKSKISNGIENLSTGGSTNGEGGIEKAYEIAVANFITGGNNRIIIATDGDFNVGKSSTAELVALIEEKRKSGVFLSAIGVGSGNYNESIAEQLANNGNGSYEYIDSRTQADKVFVTEYSKFYTVAKDVKVQVNFNPEVVESYRLIGYENRLLNNEDFEDDEEDAGEIGVNQNITALYEIVPTEKGGHLNREVFNIDFRYKLPAEDVSSALSLSILDGGLSFEDSSPENQFVIGVAGFALMLLDSQYKGSLTYGDVLQMVEEANLTYSEDLVTELKELIIKAEDLN